MNTTSRLAARSDGEATITQAGRSKGPRSRRRAARSWAVPLSALEVRIEVTRPGKRRPGQWTDRTRRKRAERLAKARERQARARWASAPKMNRAARRFLPTRTMRARVEAAARAAGVAVYPGEDLDALRARLHAFRALGEDAS